MLILGIDPGLSGAVALVSGDRRSPDLVGVWDMPTLNLASNGKVKNQLDHAALNELLHRIAILNGYVDHAVLERVGAMPGQGVTSMFNFGMVYGAIQQALAGNGLPYSFVSPRKWQSGVGLPIEGGKDASLALAKRLWPAARDEGGGLAFRLKKHDGRADAALMAYWFLKTGGLKP